MTAKEKSKELIQKYFDLFSNLGYYASLSEAKACALIAVQEILKIFSDLKEDDLDVRYWNQVKKEITNYKWSTEN